MTTLIWDNQQDYSNHEIWFIELASDEKLDEAIQILEVYKVRGEPTKVTAVIGSIDWRDAGDVSTMDEWLECHVDDLVDLFNYSDEDKAPALRLLSATCRKRIADALVRNNSTHTAYISEAKAIAADLTKEAEECDCESDYEIDEDGLCENCHLPAYPANDPAPPMVGQATVNDINRRHG